MPSAPPEPPPGARGARDALRFALEKYPQQVEVVPLEDLVTETARANPKRPAFVKLALPDEVVRDLRRGGSSGRLLLVHLPEEVLERAASRIVLPGELG